MGSEEVEVVVLKLLLFFMLAWTWSMSCRRCPFLHLTEHDAYRQFLSQEGLFFSVSYHFISFASLVTIAQETLLLLPQIEAKCCILDSTVWPMYIQTTCDSACVLRQSLMGTGFYFPFPLPFQCKIKVRTFHKDFKIGYWEKKKSFHAQSAALLYGHNCSSY